MFEIWREKRKDRKFERKWRSILRAGRTAAQNPSAELLGEILSQLPKSEFPSRENASADAVGTQPERGWCAVNKKLIFAALAVPILIGGAVLLPRLFSPTEPKGYLTAQVEELDIDLSDPDEEDFSADERIADDLAEVAFLTEADPYREMPAQESSAEEGTAEIDLEKELRELDRLDTDLSELDLDDIDLDGLDL